jgi:hypothetical protein
VPLQAVGSSLMFLFTKEYSPISVLLFPGLNFTPGHFDEDDDAVTHTVQHQGAFIHMMYVITF